MFWRTSAILLFPGLGQSFSLSGFFPPNQPIIKQTCYQKTCNRPQQRSDDFVYCPCHGVNPFKNALATKWMSTLKGKQIILTPKDTIWLAAIPLTIALIKGETVLMAKIVIATLLR